jgi:hypothetical protein
MSSCSRRIRYLCQLFYTLLTFGVDTTRFLRLGLRSPTALAAENLFLHKQLALYEERHVKPTRATNATRFALVWLSRWFDWRPALAIVQPETFSRWCRQGVVGGGSGNPSPDGPQFRWSCKGSSGRWHATISRGVSDALPTNCSSSSAFGSRRARSASTCPRISTALQANACRRSAGAILAQPCMGPHRPGRGCRSHPQQAGLLGTDHPDRAGVVEPIRREQVAGDPTA